MHPRFFGRLLKEPPRLSLPARVACAPAVTLLAFVVQLMILPRPSVAPFVLFFFAVALAAWMAGRLAGIVTVALSALVVNYYFVFPDHNWKLSGPGLRATILFLISAVAIAVLCGSLRSALDFVHDMNARLSQAAQHKDQFIAMLSHELRNPLAPIRNGVLILKDAPAGSEPAEHARDVIERQVDHLSRLVDDLLDVTRIERGRLELHPRQLELGELLRRALEDHESLFAQAGIALDASLPSEPVIVSGDLTRLAQAVGNLLSNAVKFTGPGGTATVTLTRDADGHAAVLRVRDTGSGIRRELLSHIFEAFTQADNTLERSRGGLGLGLALVKGIVELHGGRVEACSDGPGCGSEFTLRLPLAELPAAAGARPVEPCARPRRVLVVEDNADAAETLSELLRLHHHEVAVANEGLGGVELAALFHPDVVLCDIGLPGIDGYEVARRIRADARLRGVRLVAMTGYGMPDDRRRVSEAGFEQHLVKPASVEQIEAAIDQAPLE